MEYYKKSKKDPFEFLGGGPITQSDETKITEGRKPSQTTSVKNEPDESIKTTVGKKPKDVEKTNMLPLPPYLHHTRKKFLDLDKSETNIEEATKIDLKIEENKIYSSSSDELITLNTISSLESTSSDESITLKPTNRF